ncbi:MAG: TIGR00730 family Rossman fold protein [Bacteroidales bacterium]|nr:TIGR00730 family Rossman fold protein [Bacteroidales bacterium]
MANRKAVIFCSANRNIDSLFEQTAREVVRAVCSAGYDIVSGGTEKGTMAVVAGAAMEYSGHHKGVIPRFMAEYLTPDADEVVWTDTMSERKTEMRAGTCLAIALPGGIGTLDELMETLTLAKLKIYPGKVVAYNVNGFYDPLREMLDHLVETGMLYREDRALISFPSNVEELRELL